MLVVVHDCYVELFIQDGAVCCHYVFPSSIHFVFVDESVQRRYGERKKRNVYIHRCGLQTKGKRKLLLEMRSICWDESSSFMTGNSLSCSLVQSGHSSYSGKSSLCAARQLNLLPSEEKRSCRVIVNGTKHAQSIEKLPSRLRPTWCRSKKKKKRPPFFFTTLVTAGRDIQKDRKIIFPKKRKKKFTLTL